MKISDNEVIIQTDEFTVKYPRNWIRFFIVMSTMVGVICLVTFIYGEEGSHWLLYLTFIFWFAATIRLTLGFARWKLVVGKETISIHNWRGKIKTIRSDDITSIKKGEGGYKVYVDEKRVFTVSNVSETKGLIKFIRRYEHKMDFTHNLINFQQINEKNELSLQTHTVICLIRRPTSDAVMGIGITIVGTILTIYLNYIFGVEYSFLEVLPINLMYGSILICMVYFTIRYFIWRINVTSTKFTIRNSFGRERAYLITDITKVLRQKGYIKIYIKEKKVIKFDIRCTNIETFMRIIKSSLGEEIIEEKSI